MRRGFAAGVTLTDGETMAPAGVEPLTGDELQAVAHEPHAEEKKRHAAEQR